MKIVQHAHTWRGIDFADLGLALTPQAAADSSFYEAFYRALAQHPQDPKSPWHASKRDFGSWFEKQILSARTKGRILSVGAGEAISERVWLSHGYDVTLNECQPHTLADAVAEFPQVKTLIGDAYALELAERYDMAVLLTVDYALSDEQLEETFRRVGASLTPDGKLFNYTVNMLTWKQMAKEMIKHLIRRPLPRGSIRWGWMRSPDAIIKLAEAAGLELDFQYFGSGSDLAPRPRWAWRMPPAMHKIVLMGFRRRTAS